MSATNTPGAWARVVKAVATASSSEPGEGLTSGQKLVWLEVWTLDRGPDRAFASAAHLARRLGMGERNIEKARQELQGIGLLGTAPLKGKRQASWWPTLPAECRPKGERPSDDEVRRLAELLEAHIRIARQDRQRSHSTPLALREPNARAEPEYGSSPGYSGEPQVGPAACPKGVPRFGHEGGGKGEEVSPLPLKVGTTSPTSLPPSEGGVFASEPGEEGRHQAATGNLNWRESLEKPSAERQPVLIRAVLRGAHPA